MPGGIGPVDAKCARALCLTQRVVNLPAAADELQILYNLGMHRVHYFPGRNAIYFVESRHVAVQETLLAALGETAHDVTITQLYLDRLGLFKVGKRANVTPEQAATVLVALRIMGVRVTRS
ncbi:MAG: hypothetical protein KDI27_00060 [Gammaproteobacteria bacterium]|nr:hypothetical protein [Gammaproteobacteria bacterium]MCB1850255.1 hypothetical protein [Gammaproteobacteria bacterium]MCP5418605.1 hypothetical protein [Chromatiaceae bacterium]